ncbi:probable aspartic protease At2g35615 [Macadamia integrifolia]|uniref:probable aspartic protease At2g35615 n=1 Tax=Macadamia integrifolia TaxID=60698 RepID=UPI001C4EEB65|nr:probable aspartic protease At2g35615 [Macadamia integrifolia]
MVTSFSFYAIFIFFFLTFLPSINTAAANSKHPLFAFDLIHRDSPLSPLYNSDSTFWDKAERLYESSIARNAYIASKRRLGKSHDVNVDNFFFFLAKFSFGSPWVDVFAVIDSGSDLLWIQCNPCENRQPQTGLIYDPTKSKTYTNISCGSLNCMSDHHTYCDTNNVCGYRNYYVDGSYSYGFLGIDSVLFTNPDGSTVASYVTFGCGINNKFSSQGHLAGVLGLSATNLSLVSQLQGDGPQQFSYCLGNASDPSSKGNVIIGPYAETSGQTTLFTFDNLYHVNPIEIKVGSKSLNLSPKVFGPPGNVILDSGTIYTFLPPKVYRKLAHAIRKSIRSFKVHSIPHPRPGMLCYKGNIGRDLNGFPTVTIRFQGNAELVLERWSIFINDGKERFCLAFASTGGSIRRSIIGTMAQQFYNFGFHIDTQELSIIRSVCSIIPNPTM